ncbi:MAG: hypothetical protein LBS54_04235 [Dysgonamonadaceae bacterium]|jgi:hypothetical protein|nr:hypothetical protein [Dysgonamonadaceae bacterium]
MNEKQLSLVDFEQAVRLKKLGFNFPCTHKYDFSGTLTDSVEETGEYVLNSVLDKDTRLFLKSEYADPTFDTFENNEDFATPTVALALKWVRDEKNLTGLIARNATEWYFEICKAECGTTVYFSPDTLNYEQAESTLLNELLDILEEEEEQ